MKKTIIYIAPTPPPYMGPSIATQTIFNSRFVDAFNVIHIDTADRRPLNTLEKIDVSNIFLALKHYFLLFSQLIRNNVDLVYIPICQGTVGFLRDVPFIGISRLFKKKIVLHLRGGYFREFYESSNRIMKYTIKKTLDKIDKMIVLGNSLKPIFHGLLSEEKLLVVPNGLNIFFNCGRRNSSAEKPLKVLFLSNFVESKGYWDVLYSVKKVIKDHRNVKYIFAGSWINCSDKKECENYLKREKLANCVEFKGVVTGREKIEVLEEADIFVFPTYYPFEGHPWVIVEAMAVGLPIIATDQGCIRESVVDGENGFIIPKKDSGAIAEKIIHLIENQELREMMGRKSRRLYEANFTEEHFVRGMINAVNHTLK